MSDRTSRRPDTAVVSDELTQKFKTEKDTPYLRFVRSSEGLTMAFLGPKRTGRRFFARIPLAARPSAMRAIVSAVLCSPCRRRAVRRGR